MGLLPLLVAIGCGGEVIAPSELEPYLWETNGWPVTGWGSVLGGRDFRIILFLESDGAATVFYEEGIIGHGFNRMDEWADSRRRIAGSWNELSGGGYAVTDALRCELDFYHGNEHLACTLLRDVSTPGAAGTMARVFSREPISSVGSSMDDPFYDDFRD